MSAVDEAGERRLDEEWAAELEPNAPRPFALGDAPDPQEFDDQVDAEPKVTGAATHTGTDPYGRAIGPAEDHTRGKRDVDGKTASPAAARARIKKEQGQ